MNVSLTSVLETPLNVYANIHGMLNQHLIALYYRYICIIVILSMYLDLIKLEQAKNKDTVSLRSMLKGRTLQFQPKVTDSYIKNSVYQWYWDIFVIYMVW